MIAVQPPRKARVPQKAGVAERPLPPTGTIVPRFSDPGHSAGDAPEDAPSHDPAERDFACGGPPPVWKRSLDIFCILVSLPVILPLMGLITVWIKLASQGPALFRQERIGRNGKRFVLYKFRSMKMDADTRRHRSHFRNLVRSDKPMVKLDLLCDTRLLPGGCLLRAAGLDELPQLLNVLRGEMSLVGPRPCLVEEFRFFSKRQMARFEVLPGLTGIWQVHGKGAATFNEMNAMDAFYARQFSPLMDLAIMLRTPVALMSQMREVMKQKRTAREESQDSEAPSVPSYKSQRLG